MVRLFFVLMLLAGNVLPALAAVSGSQPVRCSARTKAGTVRCHAQVKTGADSLPLVSAVPGGYGPAQFHGAYAVPQTAVHPVTLGVVIAYHDPNLANDVRTYDQAFGVPVPPSLRQISQRGSRDFPAAEPGWVVEESMDVETLHQMCQNCPIVVAEADSPSMDDLMAATDQVIAQGARVVSSSYGGFERPGDPKYNLHFQRPGVTFVFSSGDSGYRVSYPASSPYVVAAGGTHLLLDVTNRRKTETAWTKSGSGCSQYEAKPRWQHDGGCTGRTVADISADADPATGAAVYDSLGYQGRSGWFVLGGTSLSAPLIAGMYGLRGGGTIAGLYGSGQTLFDVTTGHNSIRCGTYLCMAGPGYDGPTGLGAPASLNFVR